MQHNSATDPCIVLTVARGTDVAVDPAPCRNGLNTEHTSGLGDGLVERQQSSASDGKVVVRTMPGSLTIPNSTSVATTSDSVDEHTDGVVANAGELPESPQDKVEGPHEQRRQRGKGVCTAISFTMSIVEHWHRGVRRGPSCAVASSWAYSV